MRRATMFAAAALLSLSAPAEARAARPVCRPVAGAAALWKAPTRWVIVGEVHGTAEYPAAFANLACLAAAAGRPVVVALERSRDEQPAIDAYIASDGGADARAALLALPIWHDEFQDGRSSLAFLDLFERLRRLRVAGAVRRVVAVDVSAAADDRTPRDAVIAQGWRDIAPPPGGIVLALVGNAHAERFARTWRDRTLHPAASLLPFGETVTLNMMGRGGQSWDCEADGCRVHGSGNDPAAARYRVPTIAMAADPRAAWSGTYWLAAPTTASLPADPARRAPKAIDLGTVR